jgi:hypothetical protein
VNTRPRTTDKRALVGDIRARDGARGLHDKRARVGVRASGGGSKEYHK